MVRDVGGEENRMRGRVREGEGGRRKIMVREKKKVDRIKLKEGGEKRGSGASSYEEKGIEREKRKVERNVRFILRYVSD